MPKPALRKDARASTVARLAPEPAPKLKGDAPIAQGHAARERTSKDRIVADHEQEEEG